MAAAGAEAAVAAGAEAAVPGPSLLPPTQTIKALILGSEQLPQWDMQLRSSCKAPGHHAWVTENRLRVASILPP